MANRSAGWPAGGRKTNGPRAEPRHGAIAWRRTGAPHRRLTASVGVTPPTLVSRANRPQSLRALPAVNHWCAVGHTGFHRVLECSAAAKVGPVSVSALLIQRTCRELPELKATAPLPASLDTLQTGHFCNRTQERRSRRAPAQRNFLHDVRTGADRDFCRA